METIALHNKFNLVVNTTEDGSDGFHKTIHLNNQAIGVGLTSGARYQDHVQSNSSSNVADPCNFERTIVSHHLLVGTGGAPDFVIRLVFVVNVRDGEVKVTFSHLETECRG